MTPSDHVLKDTAGSRSKDIEKQEDLAATEERERAVRLEQAIAIIEAHCNDTSEFEDLRVIGRILRLGEDKLVGINLPGQTNFCYKVHLNNDHKKAVFAKVSFPFARWNPDRSQHYNLERTENEFKLMKIFQTMAVGDEMAPVSTPFFCVDLVPGEAKLLVAQWSTADTQWIEQFCDGVVDSRLIGKAAKALATLNLAECDPYFNDSCRPCMRSMFGRNGIWTKMFGDLIQNKANPDDSCIVLCRNVGVEEFGRWMDDLDKSYMTRQVLCHSDSHAFNMLVEKTQRNPDSGDTQFGKMEKLVICDWEMAIVGPTGLDAGIFQFFPLVCAICHAARGHRTQAFELVELINKFWDLYAAELINEGGKDTTFITETLRGAMRWCGVYIFPVTYMMRINDYALPLQNVAPEVIQRARGSFGAIGLKLLQEGMGETNPGFGPQELLAHYRELLGNEINSLLSLSE